MQNISPFITPEHPVATPGQPARLRRTGPVTTAALAAVAVGLIAASCGEKADASKAWCEAIGDLDATIGSIGEPDPDTIRAAFSELKAAATTIADRAPRTVSAAADRVGRAIEQAAASGEALLFEPPTSAAMAEVHAHAAAECIYEQISVVATDFAFTGIPDKVAAGMVAIGFDNQSEVETHELVLFAKSQGVDVPMAELLALGEEEAMTKAHPVAFTMAEPEGRNGLILDLEPGNYAAVCFVPVGGNEQAEPHFVHGMVTDFVVG